MLLLPHEKIHLYPSQIPDQSLPSSITVICLFFRQRTHNRFLPVRDTFTKLNVIRRMLFNSSDWLISDYNFADGIPLLSIRTVTFDVNALPLLCVHLIVCLTWFVANIAYIYLSEIMSLALRRCTNAAVAWIHDNASSEVLGHLWIALSLSRG